MRQSRLLARNLTTTAGFPSGFILTSLGSSSVERPVHVDAESWGKVKAKYREE